MSLLSNTRRFRRPLLAAAVMAAGILAVGGATAPAKAQYYPGYYPYSGYCDPYNPYGCGYGYGYPYAYGYGYPYGYGYGYGYPFYGVGFGYGFGGHHHGFRGGFHGGGFRGGGFRGGGGGFRGGGGGGHHR